MMYRYRIYGLEVASEFPLTELTPEINPDNSPADVTIRQQPLAVDYSAATEQGLLRASQDEALFSLPSVGALLVRRGEHMLADPPPDIAASTLSPLILGAGMSVLLSQRGLTVLHASSVLINGAAVAFVGHKGEGKSVMAASLARTGHPLLSDDVTALSLHDDTVTLIPAALPIRLNADALSALEIDADALPKVHELSPKRVWQPHNTGLPPLIPLRRIYVLTQAEQISVDRLSPLESFVELLRHAYLSRWSSLAHQSTDHFQQIAALANRVPVFRLQRPRDFEAMPALIDQLEAVR